VLRSAALLFLMLPALAIAEGTGASAFPLELPFSLCGGMICVKAQLADGSDHVLLLDSGNVNSWLAEKTARALLLTLEPIVNGGKTIPRAQADHLREAGPADRGGHRISCERQGGQRADRYLLHRHAPGL
jgi:hypothetical protein